MKNNKRIKVIFLCYLPEVWNSLDSVFRAMINDDSFDVTIVAIPDKEQLPKRKFNHSKFITRNAEEFFKDFPCKVINGYNYKSKHFISIKKLKPDYVFLQTPYNLHRCKKYNSARISKYAKIPYVHYGMLIFKGFVVQEVHPLDFFKDVYAVFCEDELCAQTFIQNMEKLKKPPKTAVVGYTRFDKLSSNEKGEDIWNYPRREEIKRVIWTPRWTTNENTSNFFDYKDVILDFIEKHRNIDFVFRPHPQAFLEWNATGELPKKQADEYKKRYDFVPNAKIDSRKTYQKTFKTSDVLITDISSIIPEYFITGKPIVYCNKTDMFNEKWEKIAKQCFYWVNNKNELFQTLEMLLSDVDPLKERRKEMINSELFIPINGAGWTIKEWIKKDYYGLRQD